MRAPGWCMGRGAVHQIGATWGERTETVRQSVHTYGARMATLCPIQYVPARREGRPPEGAGVAPGRRSGRGPGAHPATGGEGWGVGIASACRRGRLRLARHPRTREVGGRSGGPASPCGEGPPIGRVDAGAMAAGGSRMGARQTRTARRAAPPAPSTGPARPRPRRRARRWPGSPAGRCPGSPSGARGSPGRGSRSRRTAA